MDDEVVGMEAPSAAADDHSNPMLINMVDSFEANLAIDREDDDEEGGADGESKLDLLAEFVEEATGSLTAADVIAKWAELDIKHHKGLAVYVQVIFSEGNILELLPKQLPILKSLCKDSKCQKSLLGGLERVLGLVNKTQLPKIPVVLKKLYELDILEEEILIHWADKPSKKFVGSREVAKSVRAAAAPFIDWLKSAEEDSEDDSEEDDEEE